MSRKRSSSGTSAGDAAPKKPKTLGDKFGGMSEEEVCKLLLPDHLRPGLDIVFVSGGLVPIPSTCSFIHSDTARPGHSTHTYIP